MTTPEMTPIRCERCRAVFALDVSQTAAVGAVQCARCQFVFEPQAPAVIGSGGMLGGAASSATSPMLANPPAAPSSRRLGLLVAMTVVSLAVAVALVIRLVRVPPSANELSSLAPVRLAAGESLLWRDDTTSLESAIAAFAEAEALDPQRDLAQAERATATMLLGLSLRSDVEISVQKGTPETVRQLEERTTRGEVLMREGASLADEVFTREKAHTSWPILRAHLLSQALEGTAAEAPADSAASASPTEPSEAAWRAFCRAIATRTKLDTAGSTTIQNELEQAHHLSPGFRRATWMLAGQLLTVNPPDRARIEQLANELIRTNADHDLALKIRAALKATASP